MIVLLAPAAKDAAAHSVDEETFQYYLQYSSAGHTGGPTVVAKNLLSELRMRGDVAWTLLTPQTRLDANYSAMWVVNGLNDLFWAIKHKESLGVGQLWAGPNLVVVPQEGRGLIGHPLIDKIIVPCEWPGKVYAQLMPSIAAKIVIWPVGIDTGYWSADECREKDLILIYDKGQTSLADELAAGLCTAQENVRRITYGKYERKEYKALLNRSKMLVWLSASESQGIALLEALSMNVPGLCWKNSVWQYFSPELNIVFEYDGATSAPYFSNECGAFFKDAQDFFRQFPAFCRTQFSPRKYLFANNLAIGKTIAGAGLTI